MPIRLIVTFTALPGKGPELAQFYKTRCAQAMAEPGCEHYEVFQSAVDPDKVILLERWATQADLDRHARVNSARPPMEPELRLGHGRREDYVYNRTR